MEGPELKASTLERAYATVRLVNSLLSGLQEEPRTKEMALAKTSLIPEVNYFSLPVDLGKSGIERTFGLPQLSPLETEMVDYAIINLNNDLIKAQDLYASFKPCFEMLKSIVGGPHKFNDNCALLMDHKIDLRKKKDLKMKSNKRKRSEQQARNRKRTRANKFPIVHCPAPEVVTDMPIEEKFGKIERAHKKLQVNEVVQERNFEGLPRLKCILSGADQPETQLEHTDPTNQNINSDPALLNRTEATNIELSFSNGEIPTKIIDFIDLSNNSTSMDKVKKNVGYMNKVRNKDENKITKNFKVTIDLKSKITKRNPYDHLQTRGQSQPSNIDTVKSLMQQKQIQNQKTKVLCRSNSSTTQNRIDYLKKKAMELKTSSVTRSSNKPVSKKARISERPKEVVNKSNNDADREKQKSKISNKELPSSEKIEKTNMTALENDSFDEQFTLLMKDIDGTKISEKKIKTGLEAKGDEQSLIPTKEFDTTKETIETKGDKEVVIRKKVFVSRKKTIKTEIENKASEEMVVPKQVISVKEKVKTGIETNDDQETFIPKKEVITKIENKKHLLGNEGDALKANDKINEINYGTDQKEKITTFSESDQLVEGTQNVHQSCNLKKETNDMALDNGLKTLICEENKSDTQIASGDNNKIPTSHDKDSKISENKIILEGNVNETEGENEVMKDKSDCTGSSISAAKSLEIEINEQKHKPPCQIKSRDKTAKEAEKQDIQPEIYDVTKQNISEGISKPNVESANENEITKQKFSFTVGQTLDQGKAVIEIDAHEKLEELEYLSKRQEKDELEENKQKNPLAKLNYDPSEQVKKIREITMQQIKEPLKYLELSKQETKRVKETEKEIKTEGKKGVNEDNLDGSIHVFNYEPKNMHDTKNITNINEILHGLVTPEANSEPPPVVSKSNNNIKDEVVDSKSPKVKVINVKKKEPKQLSKDKKLKKDEKRPQANINLELKPQKETPFPFLNKIKEIPKNEPFDKNKWIKTKMQPVTNKASPAKVNLKTIDESKALTIHSRNINESFTKRIQTSQRSNKTIDDVKSVSYAINTKYKKDELSKRYTVLKKGQLCTMVKDDINAEELKAKLFKKSNMKVFNKPSFKRDDNNITHTKDLTTELLKSPVNKEINSSKPTPDVLENAKKLSFDISNDANNFKKLKKSSNNVVNLKNKSFLNMVINRTPKRSPTLNETTEAIGVRGSHYESGGYSKKCTASNEQRIQQLTKKAKEQLNITRFKNNKRISPGLSGSLPVVSKELGEKRQPVPAVEEEKTKSTRDSNDNMLRSRNKIQMMKEKYQRLKNGNSSSMNIYVTSQPTGTNIVKETKRINHSTKNQLSETSSKSNPEPKNVTKKEGIVKKQAELSSVDMSGKEIATNSYRITKSEPQELVLNEKGDSSIDCGINKKQAINYSEVYNKKHGIEKEECSEPTQVISTPPDDKNIAMATFKISPQENQQDLQDKNKLVKECFDNQPALSKPLEEEKNVTVSAISNTQPLKDEATSNTEKVERNISASIKQLNLKKKVPDERAQELEKKNKTKEKINKSKDLSHSKESSNTPSKGKSQQPKMSEAHKNALMKIKATKKKPIDDHSQRVALKAVFASRPTASDLIKIKKEQKTSDKTIDKTPSHNLGMRTAIHNKLIPNQSTASSLLLDPDIEKRPQTNRKVIHPSLMHAVKPFTGQNKDLKKFKTNFYSRWTPQALKLRDNKEGDTNTPKNEETQKNPFVSGKINLTSDLFKAYMKKNRNYEVTNSNMEVQFLHQSGQLASIPQQGGTANAKRINDQRVAFSTLEAYPDKNEITKIKSPTVVSSYRFQSRSKTSNNEKAERPQSLFFNKKMRSNDILSEVPTQEPSAKGKNISNKSKPVTSTKHKPNNPLNPFRYKEKEVDLKRMHLLKAYQNRENEELKFEELQRNYKQQKSRPGRSVNIEPKEVSKETPNRLQMLKTNSLSSMKNVPTEVSRRNKKPFSAPADYHPSFPLSKPKKYEKNNKKDENVNSLKKRWTQLLDIFQSVITTEKKNWEQDSPERNLLVGGHHTAHNAMVAKAKNNLRETSHNSNSTAKIVQSYYRRHTGDPKFQSTYSIGNRSNKM